MMKENTKGSSDVVIQISGEEKDAKSPLSSKLGAESPHRISADSTESVAFGPSPNRSPKIPTTQMLTRKKSSSKSKSRFGEQTQLHDSSMFEEQTLIDKINSNSLLRKTSNRASSNRTASSRSLEGGGDEEAEICKKVGIRKKLKLKWAIIKVLIEWVAFLCIVGCLAASLTVEKLEYLVLWDLEIWKWCVLVMVIFFGMLITNRFMHFVVFMIELNFLLKKKVLYFVHGLKKSVQVCIWLSFVLVTWVLLFIHSHGVKRSAIAIRILDSVTWTIVSLLIGSFLWLCKTLLLKILASSFHVNTFFDRIQESLNNQYVLQTLAGPPLVAGRTNSSGRHSGCGRWKKKGKEGKKKEVIELSKIHEMKKEKVSAWTMKMMVDKISNSGLSTLSNALDEGHFDGEGDQEDKKLTTEEGIAAAHTIFKNVAKSGHDYIYETDLERFMIKEEVEAVLPMLEQLDVNETGQISKKAFIEWVVKVFIDRKALALALNDTKTAVNQLNKLVTGILIVVMVIVWLLLMEIATTKVLVVLSSQLLVAAFIFGNTCKTMFEAIIFVFVMHPFDVGDRCVIDGVQMIVEEMNILSTVFLKFDSEKIYYPNSVLATKPISNFYRSSNMGDSFEFSIDFTTTVETIGHLKEKIKKYLEDNPLYWQANHNVVVKEIENQNKIKMVLFFNHTMNFQDFPEKNRRRSELVIEMKNIFEDLKIKYNLLPQEVSLVDTRTTTQGTSN